MREDEDVANCSQNVYLSGLVSLQGNCQWWQATQIKYSLHMRVLPKLVSVIRHKGRGSAYTALLKLLLAFRVHD